MKISTIFEILMKVFDGNFTSILPMWMKKQPWYELKDGFIVQHDRKKSEIVDVSRIEYWVVQDSLCFDIVTIGTGNDEGKVWFDVHNDLIEILSDVARDKGSLWTS